MGVCDSGPNHKPGVDINFKYVRTSKSYLDFCVIYDVSEPYPQQALHRTPDSVHSLINDENVDMHYGFSSQIETARLHFL